MIENYYEAIDLVCNEIASNDNIQYELFEFLMEVCHYIGYIASC